MRRSLLAMVPAAALYGFAGGAIHSWLYAARNLIKFPLLIVVTALVCAISYYFFARLLAARLSFLDVQRLVLRLFRDLSVLLAGLSPVVLFLALTFTKPAGDQLGDYPFFLAFNVFLIGFCGVMALYRQARTLLSTHGLSPRRGLALIALWLALTFLVGSQWAWYLRPFYGVASVAPQESFCLGTRPDFRGDTDFYTAMFHAVFPPSRAEPERPRATPESAAPQCTSGSSP